MFSGSLWQSSTDIRRPTIPSPFSVPFETSLLCDINSSVGRCFLNLWWYYYVWNSRNLAAATAGEKVGRSRHQILQILPLLVDLCEGWAATWEGLIKIWNLQTRCQGRKGGGGGGKHQSIFAENWRQGSPSETLSLLGRLFFLSFWEPLVKLAAKYFRWLGEWESKVPQKPPAERKAEKGSIDFMLNRPPSLPFLAALTLMVERKVWPRSWEEKEGLRAKPTWRTLLSPATVSGLYLHNGGETWSYSISGPTHRRKAQWPATWGGIFHCSWPATRHLAFKKSQLCAQRPTVQ